MAVTEVWLVRHGESVANVAAARAAAAGDDLIAIDERDADVPLSTLGEQQSQALGTELADRGIGAVPVALWVSPFRRAQQTIDIALRSGGVDVPLRRVDERLRDRELGVLERHTLQGVERRHPDEHERRQRLGKYYHRPAGGESWVDVQARLRSLFVDVDRIVGPQRLVIAAHDIVVTLAVAVCLDLDEQALADFTDANPVGNASLTRLGRSGLGDPWALDEFSAVDHLD